MSPQFIAGRVRALADKFCQSTGVSGYNLEHTTETREETRFLGHVLNKI